MVDAIAIIGWRSDEGAYLVDTCPPGFEVDGQDLLNLFSLHRMAANGVMERAGPDFNYLRLSNNLTLASWYSGFKTTAFLGRPNYCVILALRQGENPNQWEEPLRVICYNVLMKLTDGDLANYMQYILDNVNKGYAIEPMEGYQVNVEATPPPTPASTVNMPKLSATAPASIEEKPPEKDEFADLIAMAEEQASSSKSGNGSSPSATGSQSMGAASGADPFGNTGTGASGNPFAGDPFAKATPPRMGGSAASQSNTAKAGKPAKGLPISSDEPAPETSALLQELKNLDRTTPPKPTNTEDKDALFGYYEKKVGFLEAKINVFGKLLRNLQLKEVELNEKNELIAKLMALLS